MTYKEFKQWCEDRKNDCEWGIWTAMACLTFVSEVESVKKPWLHIFKKHLWENVKEAEWQRLNDEWKIEEIFVKGNNEERKKLMDSFPPVVKD